MSERTKKTIEVWDRCECGRILHSISEGQRGLCSSCWVASMPKDTKASLNRLISMAFKPATDAEKDAAVKDAMDRLREGH